VAGAQEPRVITVGGAAKAISVMGASLPISEETLRAMISEHLPEAFDPGTETRGVSIVIDANNQYVSGHTQKAIAISPSDSDGVRVITGDDSTSARVVKLRRSEGAAGMIVAGGANVFMLQREGLDGPFGGFSPDDVSSIGVKRFAAGQLTEAPVIVSIV